MYLCGLAQVAVVSLIATKLAVGDCSGFHACGLGLLVPACPVTIRAVLSKSCCCKPWGLPVSQGSEVGEGAKKQKYGREGRGERGGEAMAEGKGEIENPCHVCFSLFTRRTVIYVFC